MRALFHYQLGSRSKWGGEREPFCSIVPHLEQRVRIMPSRKQRPRAIEKWRTTNADYGRTALAPSSKCARPPPHGRNDNVQSIWRIR